MTSVPSGPCSLHPMSSWKINLPRQLHLHWPQTLPAPKANSTKGWVGVGRERGSCLTLTPVVFGGQWVVLAGAWTLELGRLRFSHFLLNSVILENLLNFSKRISDHVTALVKTLQRLLIALRIKIHLLNYTHISQNLVPDHLCELRLLILYLEMCRSGHLPWSSHLPPFPMTIQPIHMQSCTGSEIFT